MYIVTSAPVYDANDNVVEAAAPNGAVSSYVYDAADRMVSESLPVDEAGDPQRTTLYGYDLVGNLTSVTEPKGVLSTGVSDDFVTGYGYDAINQLVSVTNAVGDQIGYGYDNVGNLVTLTDPRGSTTAHTYDLAHRRLSATDAAGETTSSEYDLDGNVVVSTDQEGNTTLVDYDARGLVTEVRVPHDDASGSITYRTTRYAYDAVGNRTRVVTPRGVQAADPDAFVHELVYDELNRVVERRHPFDPGDPVFNTADVQTYAYDVVGNLVEVSAPPSQGQQVRNTTTYSYFDNGWVESSTDPWGITTSYDYDELGQQTLRTLTRELSDIMTDVSVLRSRPGRLRLRRPAGGVRPFPNSGGLQ